MSTVPALQRIKKAREQLLQPKWAWWGSLALRLRLAETATVTKTCATDGTYLYFNPRWVATISDEILRTVVAHEAGHDALLHPYRLGGRELKLANVAADHVINLLLLAANLPLWEGALADRRFSGMGFEQVYAILWTEREAQREQDRKDREAAAQKAQERQQPQAGGSEDADEDFDGEDADDDSEDEGAGAPQDGQDGDDEDEEGNDPADGEDEAEAGADADGEDDSEAEGADAGGSEPDGDDDEPDAGDAGDLADEDDAAPADEDVDGADPADEAEAEQPGEVIPPSQTLEQRDAEQAGGGEPKPALTQNDWVRVVEELALQLDRPGLMPGNLRRAITESRREAPDCWQVLRQFIQESVPTDECFTTPDRRFIAQGTYWPGENSDTCAKIALVVDTSLSISRAMLADFRDHFATIVREYRPSELVLLFADESVRSGLVFTAADDYAGLDFRPVGGGGTAFGPALRFLEQMDDPPVACVYLTDLCGENTLPGVKIAEPSFRMLWATPAHITIPAPFGDVIRLPVPPVRAA